MLIISRCKETSWCTLDWQGELNFDGILFSIVSQSEELLSMLCISRTSGYTWLNPFHTHHVLNLSHFIEAAHFTLLLWIPILSADKMRQRSKGIPSPNFCWNIDMQFCDRQYHTYFSSFQIESLILNINLCTSQKIKLNIHVSAEYNGHRSRTIVFAYLSTIWQQSPYNGTLFCLAKYFVAAWSMMEIWTKLMKWWRVADVPLLKSEQQNRCLIY